MAGSIIATLTGDWREPYAVRLVDDDTGPEEATRYRTQRDAQAEMLRLQDEHPDFTLVYNLCDSDASTSVESGEPRTLTVEEFHARVKKICGKCRVNKPLNTYRQIFRNDSKGRPVMHGWEDHCLSCEEEAS